MRLFGPEALMDLGGFFFYERALDFGRAMASGEDFAAG